MGRPRRYSTCWPIAWQTPASCCWSTTGPSTVKKWGNRSYYTQLRLDPLATENTAEMLSELLGDGPELRSLKHMIAERTEGNPFFIEEIIQALSADGELVRNGTVKLVR